MKTFRQLAGHLTLMMGLNLSCLIFSGCEYEVPLTAASTRSVERKLLGDWTSKDGKDVMKVRELDDTSYAVSYNGDLYRAFHSDFAGSAFVSVLHLDADNRKYSLLAWSLTDDARGLKLRVVSSKVVSKELSDSVALQRELQKNLNDPALFGFEQDYRRTK